MAWLNEWCDLEGDELFGASEAGCDDNGMVSDLDVYRGSERRGNGANRNMDDKSVARRSAGAGRQ